MNESEYGQIHKHIISHPNEFSTFKGRKEAVERRGYSWEEFIKYGRKRNQKELPGQLVSRQQAKDLARDNTSYRFYKTGFKSEDGEFLHRAVPVKVREVKVRMPLDLISPHNPGSKTERKTQSRQRESLVYADKNELIKKFFK